MKHISYHFMIQACGWVLACAVALPAAAQSDYGFPYNPDYDNNGEIEIGDLLQFLPWYGGTFTAEGVLPVAGGGTGSTHPAAARDSLGLSMLQDTTIGNIEYAYIHGALRGETTFSHGLNANATGAFAQASGLNVTASGAYSHAQNRLTSATATCSSAAGEGSTAAGVASHAQGMSSLASGTAAHAEGYATDATANYAHAEGYVTLASNTAAHAEGYLTDATGLYSHAENRTTIASGTASHAEGDATHASGSNAHAEGYQTDASGYAAHAEGYQTEASGLYSSSHGRQTQALNNSSAAFGLSTVADADHSFVLGQYNALELPGMLFAVGNGALQARSNALTVYLDGNVDIPGTLTVNGQDQTATIDSLTSRVTALETAVELLMQQVDTLLQGQ